MEHGNFKKKRRIQVLDSNPLVERKAKRRKTSEQRRIQIEKDVEQEELFESEKIRRNMSLRTLSEKEEVTAKFPNNCHQLTLTPPLLYKAS